MRLLAPIALALALVSSPATAQTPPPDPRLLIIGDSVILGAQPWVVPTLSARGWQVNQTSYESMHTWEAPAIVDANRARFGLGKVVIIQLGTNDGISPTELASYVDTLMQHLTTVDRVFWVNMRQFTSWVPAANAVLATAATKWPNLRIVDWDARATPDPSLVYGDGYHLNPRGQAVMAQLLAQALDAYVAEVTAATTTTLPPTTVPPTTVADTEVSSKAVSKPSTEDGFPITTGLATFAGVLLAAGVLALLVTRADTGRRRTPMG